MKLKTPIDYEGKTYDQALVSLSSGHVPFGNDFTTGVNLTVIPARYDEEGKLEILPQKSIRVVITGDIKGNGSEKELEDFNAINAIVGGHLLYRDIITLEE